MPVPELLSKPNEFQVQFNDMKRGTPGYYKSQIEAYIELRKACAEEWWDFAYSQYERTDYHYSSGMGDDPNSLMGRFITPARVYSYTQSLIAQVFGQAPYFVIEPGTGRSEKLAHLFQVMQNDDWMKNYTKKRHVRRCIKDTSLTGFSWMWTGYESDFDKAKRARARRNKIADMIQGNPNLGLITSEMLAEEALGTDSATYDPLEYTFEMTDAQYVDEVCSRHVPAKQIMVDPCCSGIEDAQWIFREVVADYDAVMEDPYLKNTANLQPSMELGDLYLKATGSVRFKSHWDSPSGQGRKKFVCLYLGYLRNRDGTWDYKVFANGHEKWLREVAAQYDVGCPVSCLRWNDLGERILTVSDIQQANDILLEERLLRTRLLGDTIRKMGKFIGYDKTAIDQTEMDSMLASTDEVVAIGFQGLNNKSLQAAIGEIPTSSAVYDLANHLAIIEKDFERAFGLGQNQMFGAMKSGTTATESREVGQWVQARLTEKREAVEEFLASVCFNEIALKAQFYDEQKIAQIAGEEAAKVWVAEKFTRGDIQNGLSVSVHPGSTQPISEEKRAANLSQMVQEAIAAPAIMGQIVNVPEAYKQLLEARGVKDGSSVLMNLSGQQFSQMAMQMALMGQMQGGGQPGQNGGSPPRTAQNASNAEVSSASSQG
jgi:hypothetical protein